MKWKDNRYKKSKIDSETMVILVIQMGNYSVEIHKRTEIHYKNTLSVLFTYSAVFDTADVAGAAEYEPFARDSANKSISGE